jgi:hypothetical protein
MWWELESRPSWPSKYHREQHVHLYGHGWIKNQRTFASICFYLVKELGIIVWQWFVETVAIDHDARNFLAC